MEYLITLSLEKFYFTILVSTSDSLQKSQNCHTALLSLNLIKLYLHFLMNDEKSFQISGFTCLFPEECRIALIMIMTFQKIKKKLVFHSVLR